MNKRLKRGIAICMLLLTAFSMAACDKTDWDKLSPDQQRTIVEFLTSKRQIALRTAYAQIGKPYRYGAAGPNSFDCSGFVMFSFRSAGVGLPHSAATMRGLAQRISASEAVPGDLVFNGYPAQHVGIYVGNGQEIHAPHTGTVVHVANIWDYQVSYGRIV